MDENLRSAGGVLPCRTGGAVRAAGPFRFRAAGRPDAGRRRASARRTMDMHFL